MTQEYQLDIIELPFDNQEFIIPNDCDKASDFYIYVIDNSPLTLTKCTFTFFNINIVIDFDILKKFGMFDSLQTPYKLPIPDLQFYHWNKLRLFPKYYDYSIQIESSNPNIKLSYCKWNYSNKDLIKTDNNFTIQHMVHVTGIGTFNKKIHTPFDSLVVHAPSSTNCTLKNQYMTIHTNKQHNMSQIHKINPDTYVFDAYPLEYAFDLVVYDGDDESNNDIYVLIESTYNIFDLDKLKQQLIS